MKGVLRFMIGSDAASGRRAARLLVSLAVATGVMAFCLSGPVARADEAADSGMACPGAEAPEETAVEEVVPCEGEDAGADVGLPEDDGPSAGVAASDEPDVEPAMPASATSAEAADGCEPTAPVAEEADDCESVMLAGEEATDCEPVAPASEEATDCEPVATSPEAATDCEPVAPAVEEVSQRSSAAEPQREAAVDASCEEPAAEGALPAAAGSVMTGWQRDADGSLRYYDDDGTQLFGECLIDGSWYYLDPEDDGRMATGLVRVPVSEGSGSFKTAYYGTDGVRVTGQANVDGSELYFDEETGALTTGFVAVDEGALRFFSLATGQLVTGELTVNGAWRSFDETTGDMDTGWTYASTDSAWIYCDAYGRRQVGEQWIDGDRYWFDLASGTSDPVEHLRWLLNQASGSDGVSLFNGANVSGASMAELAQALASFANEGLSVGFVLMDLNTGRGVASDADGTYYSASTVKGPYVASVYDKVFCSDTGASAAWSQTLYDTCVWSDNDAYYALRSAFGSEPFASWLYEAGVDPSLASSYYTWYSPRELGKMWLRMYAYFSEGGAAGQELAELLSHGYCSSIYNELGGLYAVRTKAGWYPYSPGYTATNDAGVVYAGGSPYLLVVLSDAPERFDLLEALVRALDVVHVDLLA